MLRNLLLVTLLLMCAAEAAFGQASDVEHPPVISHGGGIGAWISLANLGALNELLAAQGYGPLPEGFLVFGGGGVVGEVYGVRTGGAGAGGEAYSYRGERVAKLEFAYGGFTLDQGVLHGESYDLSIGATLGGGEAVLTLQAHRPDTFEEAVSNPVNSVLGRGFWLIQPHVSLKLSVLPSLALQLNATYLWTLTHNWQQQDLVLPGPPSDFNGWSLEVGFSLGGVFED